MVLISTQIPPNNLPTGLFIPPVNLENSQLSFQLSCGDQRDPRGKASSNIGMTLSLKMKPRRDVPATIVSLVISKFSERMEPGNGLPVSKCLKWGKFFTLFFLKKKNKILR